MNILLDSKPSENYYQLNTKATLCSFNNEVIGLNISCILIFHGLEGKRLKCYDINGKVVWEYIVKGNMLKINQTDKLINIIGI